MSDHTSLCATCKFLDGDECGPSCPKLPAGLPFQERIKKCKYYKQVKICPILNKPCLLDMDCFKGIKEHNQRVEADGQLPQKVIDLLKERTLIHLLEIMRVQNALDPTEKIQKQQLDIMKDLIKKKGE